MYHVMGSFRISHFDLYYLYSNSNPDMEDYVWHWYIINGYEAFADSFMVKTVTYGTWRWFDLAVLWDTGYERKGGLILFS